MNKKIEQLELKLHTKKYIHLPKPSLKGLGKFNLAIIFTLLSYFNLKLILKIWEDYNLGYVFAPESELVNYTPKFADLIVSYPLIGEYIFISLTIIFTVSMFKELKGYDERGLIYGLIRGLISGIIIGLIFGLILGTIFGLIFGLISGIIFGLISGIIIGLIFGTICGLIILIIGTIEEFRE